MTRKSATPTPIQSERGSDNVFLDIGIPEPDLALAKVCLAEAIDDTIRQRGLTQEAAARIMGIDQGTVSRIINERLDGFSQERLIKYLNALGNDVEIRIAGNGRSGTPGRLIVNRVRESL